MNTTLELFSNRRLDRASKAPSSPQTTARNEELETLEAAAIATTTSLTGTTTGGFSQGSILSPRRNPERKKLDFASAKWCPNSSTWSVSLVFDRLWTVLTNPKVRCASLKEKAGYERDRQMPTKIEGIKPLMLYKLYNGPWRLDAPDRHICAFKLQISVAALQIPADRFLFLSERPMVTPAVSVRRNHKRAPKIGISQGLMIYRHFPMIGCKVWYPQFLDPLGNFDDDLGTFSCFQASTHQLVLDKGGKIAQ
eukprot:s1314_g19.t1